MHLPPLESGDRDVGALPAQGVLCPSAPLLRWHLPFQPAPSTWPP